MDIFEEIGDVDGQYCYSKSLEDCRLNLERCFDSKDPKLCAKFCIMLSFIHGKDIPSELIKGFAESCHPKLPNVVCFDYLHLART